MAEFNAAATQLINRLSALDYDEPHFNADKVIEHMRRHYELLGVPMPKIEIAGNMVAGFQIARGAARGAARDAAWDAAAGLASRDLIGPGGFTQERYDLLTGPWRRVIGKIHAEDADMAVQS